MKKIFIFVLLLFLIPSVKVNAQDYTLKSGVSVAGTYNEADYNYYSIKVNKGGYIGITAKTSDKSDLLIDICNLNKEVIASDIVIPNGETILHKADKGGTYYIRIKGTPEITFHISYKMKSIGTLTYAKKYNYTFTNASFDKEKNAILLKMKANLSGIINLMCDANDTVTVKYLNNSKKAISKNMIMYKKSLSGIGVQAGKSYYAKFWKPEKTISGTTTFTNLKYQIKNVAKSNLSSKAKAKSLSRNKYTETLVPAGTTNTSWYKFKVTKKNKISISIESRLLQNNGKCLQLYICNATGKKINTNAIRIEDTATYKYKSKKYIMRYPVKTFKTTVAFPIGTYYLKVVSGTKTSSGSYRIKWK